MKRSFLVLPTILLVAGSALADSVTIKALGQMKPDSSTSPGVFLFSVDGKQTVGFSDQAPGMALKGQTWTATILPFSDFSKATFGSDTDAMADYEAAAWLIQQEPRGGSQNIQMAIWALFNPAVENSKAWDMAAANWLSKAEGNSYTLSQFADFSILTPAGCVTARCAPVELLVPSGADGGASPSPEPASMVLFGLGLLALGATLRRKLLG